MLIDHRTYTVRPMTLKKQLALYEEFGFPVQLKYIGQPLAFMEPMTGDLNSFVHLWVYDDVADRTRRRSAMEADPAWKIYTGKLAETGYLIKIEIKFLTPTSFAPLRMPPRPGAPA